MIKGQLVQGLSLIRRLLPYTSAAFVLAQLYLAWTFYARWHNSRAIQQAAEAEKAKADAQIVKMYAGDLKILTFYTTGGTIRRGEKTLLCYGVASAARVRIEPGVEALKPSLSRCVEVAPRKDTVYSLTAEDEAGHSVTQSLAIRVR
jgi:hypothetical protein